MRVSAVVGLRSSRAREGREFGSLSEREALLPLRRGKATRVRPGSRPAGGAAWVVDGGHPSGGPPDPAARAACSGEAAGEESEEPALVAAVPVVEEGGLLPPGIEEDRPGVPPPVALPDTCRYIERDHTHELEILASA